MKITQIYKLNVIALSVVCFTGLFAQHKENKLNQKFAVGDDVVININTSHTSIVFETWNKNTVGIEAYIEGDYINTENRERILHNWQVEATGTHNEVTIKAITGNFWRGEVATTSKNKNAIDANMTQYRILAPMIADMLSPLMKNIENNPMPSALAENLASMNFDTQKYRENEEKYIQQWGDQIKEKFGDNSNNIMKQWTKKLSRNAKQLDIGTESYWGGEDFVRQMQTWASQFSGDIENIQIVQTNGTNMMVYSYSSNINKPKSTAQINRIIKVHIPKASRLRLNIRHGDVELPEKINNVVASLSHTTLQANEINGKKTYIRSSYSPLHIKQWNDGQLVINYVKNCRIKNANNLTLNADSSNIFIQELQGSGAIGGSFGNITIANLSETFTILDLAIENSDFKLKLPNTAYNLTYNGAQSRISIPKTLETQVRRNFGNVFVNGFNKTRNTNKVITVNAKYSDIVLQ